MTVRSEFFFLEKKEKRAFIIYTKVIIYTQLHQYSPASTYAEALTAAREGRCGNRSRRSFNSAFSVSTLWPLVSFDSISL